MEKMIGEERREKERRGRIKGERREGERDK